MANQCRRTPIGALHRALWIHIPKALVSLDQRLTSGKVTGAFAKGFDVMMHDRHPTVVVSGIAPGRGTTRTNFFFSL